MFPRGGDVVTPRLCRYDLAPVDPHQTRAMLSA
jgi:hypothetical protein